MVDGLVGSAAPFSAPTVTPDLAYAEIMFIRSFADFNRALRVVKLVRVGAITAQVHDSRKRRDQPAKECGLLVGRHRGLSHAADAITPATPCASPATTGKLRSKRVFVALR